MLHPMNLPSEHSNLGVVPDADVIRTEAGVTWTPLIMSIVPSTTQDSEHRLRFSTRLVTQRKNRRQGAWWKLEGGRKEYLAFCPKSFFLIDLDQT